MLLLKLTLSFKFPKEFVGCDEQLIIGQKPSFYLCNLANNLITPNLLFELKSFLLKFLEICFCEVRISILSEMIFRVESKGFSSKS